MSAKQISQWRTVGIVGFAVVLLLVALLLAMHWATPSGAKDAAPVALDLDKAARLYEHFTDAVVWLVAAVAFKSGVEHLGKGRGVNGAKAALLTEATPADPAPPAPGGTP